jgi:hypothetical protein
MMSPDAMDAKDKAVAKGIGTTPNVPTLELVGNAIESEAELTYSIDEEQLPNCFRMEPETALPQAAMLKATALP